jgi:signal-transduction protein with cAMP-binding, CBS, and nucleotidyltransferase domain
VITSSGNYSGILDKNDLIQGLTSRGKEAKIGEVMRRDTESVNCDTPLFNIYQNMQKNRLQTVPVFEKGKFVGVLDLDNINQLFLIRQALQ